MGNTLLKWKKPPLVHRASHKLDGWFLVLQWVAGIALTVLLIRNVLQHDYLALYQTIFMTGVFWIFNRVVPTYKIGDMGISYEDGYRRLHLNWSDIEWYYFSAEATTPNMKQVQFSLTKGKWRKAPPAFVFNPQEIDEERLLHILEQYLPQKELGSIARQLFQVQGPWA